MRETFVCPHPHCLKSATGDVPETPKELEAISERIDITVCKHCALPSMRHGNGCWIPMSGEMIADAPPEVSKLIVAMIRKVAMKRCADSGVPEDVIKVIDKEIQEAEDALKLSSEGPVMGNLTLTDKQKFHDN